MTAPGGGGGEPRLREAAGFVLLACALSWSLSEAFFALGGRDSGALGMLLMATLYMWMPALAAVLLERKWGRGLLGRLGLAFRPNRAWLWAWLLPAPLVLLTVAASALLPGVRLDPSMSGYLEGLARTASPEQLELARRQLYGLLVHPFWLGLLAALVVGPTANGVIALGEELGWRGFLHGRLRPLGFWTHALWIGIAWGLWHAPLILRGHNYPEHPRAGVLMMVLFTVLVSPLFSFVREAGRSVLPAAILHGTINASGALVLRVLAGGSDLSVGLTGAAGAGVLLGFNAALFLWRRRRPGPAGGRVGTGPGEPAGR